MRGVGVRNAAKRTTLRLNLRSSSLVTRNASTSTDASVAAASASPSSSEAQEPLEVSLHASDKLQRVLSGIQPTGVPHLGNYLGALRQWKRLQDEKVYEHKNRQLLFSIVDLHALTSTRDRSGLYEKTRQSFASLLAIGLDPKHSVLFVQSRVSYHTRLMWILSTFASMGQLSRMTQWKSKIGASEDASMDDENTQQKLKLGLFSYPVLQAADILLYRPTHVPVGEDQKQHVEFARTLAGAFNYHVGRPSKDAAQLFFKPRPMLPQGSGGRIKSLTYPRSKMSKSDPNEDSRILITDTAEVIHAKIRAAFTDSISGITYDPGTRPGIANLLTILENVSGSDASCEQLAKDNANLSMRAFKELVAQSVVKELEGISDRYNEFMSSRSNELDKIMTDGSREATRIASRTMTQVDVLVGLRPSDWKETNNWKESYMSNKRKERVRTDESNTEADKKSQIQREQELEEQQQESEPDVLPQQKDGVIHPIAS